MRWERYRRTGSVHAERRDAAWSWTTTDGQPMQADAGDWQVRDDAGCTWSVRDDIFRATYEQAPEGRWRRTGTVQARRACPGEVVDTLEGAVRAESGQWVLRGDAGEQWPVPAEHFARCYEGPVVGDGSAGDAHSSGGIGRPGQSSM